MAISTQTLLCTEGLEHARCCCRCRCCYCCCCYCCCCCCCCCCCYFCCCFHLCQLTFISVRVVLLLQKDFPSVIFSGLSTGLYFWQHHAMMLVIARDMVKTCREDRWYDWDLCSMCYKNENGTYTCKLHRNFTLVIIDKMLTSNITSSPSIRVAHVRFFT